MPISRGFIPGCSMQWYVRYLLLCEDSSAQADAEAQSMFGKNKKRCGTQGMALRLYHEDIRTARFADTIKRVLTEPSFRLAAQRISVKLRARSRTPTQEAAGEPLCFSHST